MLIYPLQPADAASLGGMVNQELGLGRREVGGQAPSINGRGAQFLLGVSTILSLWRFLAGRRCP